jgi:hypothetical protein
VQRVLRKQLFTEHENQQGANDGGRSVRGSEGRLEGIVLLPPQVTLIRESSFSKVKVCGIGDGQRASDVDRKLEQSNSLPQVPRRTPTHNPHPWLRFLYP